jgi:subtilisin family serine protease
MFSAERLEVWQSVRRQRILGEPAKSNVLEGPGYFYRPEQLLVNTEDLPLVAEQLRRTKATENPELSRQFAEHGIPITVFTVVGVPIPALVSRLRAVRDEGDPVPRVGPNHVFGGEPLYHAGPGGEPSPAAAADGPWSSPAADAPKVAALDTGIPADLATQHPELFERILTEGDDIDPLFSTGDLLEHDAGHGTFVSGILMQLAPWLRIDPEKVLDEAGLGDDAHITLGMAKAGCALVNASLGGYTHDDMPPPAFEAFLAKGDPESVLVAAAGNNSQGRPFWPAAFKHVIAVGAVDSRGGTPIRAPFSNFGDWVDCCAPGVEIRSTYVKGEWRLDAPGDDGSIEQLEGWACWSGTSFATPHVTAAIAARMQGTGLTPRQAAHAVLADATVHVPGLGFYVEPSLDLNCPDCKTTSA